MKNFLVISLVLGTFFAFRHNYLLHNYRLESEGENALTPWEFWVHHNNNLGLKHFIHFYRYNKIKVDSETDLRVTRINRVGFYKVLLLWLTVILLIIETVGIVINS